jgi:hypothetical protein
VEEPPGSLVAATAPGREVRGADAAGFAVEVVFLTAGTVVVPFVRVVKGAVAFVFGGVVVERVVVVSLALGGCFAVDDVDFVVPAAFSGGGNLF